MTTEHVTRKTLMATLKSIAEEVKAGKQAYSLQVLRDRMQYPDYITVWPDKDGNLARPLVSVGQRYEFLVDAKPKGADKKGEYLDFVSVGQPAVALSPSEAPQPALPAVDDYEHRQSERERGIDINVAINQGREAAQFHLARNSSGIAPGGEAFQTLFLALWAQYASKIAQMQRTAHSAAGMEEAAPQVAPPVAPSATGTPTPPVAQHRTATATSAPHSGGVRIPDWSTFWREANRKYPPDHARDGVNEKLGFAPGADIAAYVNKLAERSKTSSADVLDRMIEDLRALPDYEAKPADAAALEWDGSMPA